MIAKNTLVLYKQDAAVVTEAAEKLTIETKNGPVKVREKDVAVIAANAPPLTKVTANVEAFAKKSGTSAKLAEAWELLADEAGAIKSLSDLAILAFGHFTPEDAWGYFCAIRQSPFFAEVTIVAPGGTGESAVAFTVRTQGEVETLQQKQAAKAADGEKRGAFIERLKKRQALLSEDAPFMQEVEAVALGQSTKSRVLTDVGVPVDPEKAHRLLLDTGFWTNWKNPYPARYGLSAKSAQGVLTSPPEEPRHTVNHTAFAIDNAWSTDPDDAVF